MAKGKSRAEELKEKLCFESKNLWNGMNDKTFEEVMAFNRDYQKALDQGKTEREFYDMTIAILEKAGFRDMAELEEVKAGDKVYRGVHGKGLFAAIVGSGDPANGSLLVGSHIDSPRLDLKPNPLYEKNEMALLKTHYYGGIKKYHWAATQLSLHGVVILKNGEKVNISIGEEEDDPVFTITDLLPHLGKDQMSKKASEVIEGEGLNLLFGGIPFAEEDVKEPVKLAILERLYERYGLTERDLITAELEVVPAHKAKDVGFDRCFIGAYGQDDRVCAWTSLQALLACKPREKTQGIFFFDKEETGSDGNTGACSALYMHALNELHRKFLKREPGILELQSAMANTQLLSSDVSNAFDPNYPEVSEPLNSSYCSKGISICKYTGARGKGGTTDANAEFFNLITRLFDEHKIPWQTGELGKVDQGGGGTIAKFFANNGMQVIDCGVPVLSMHSCFEVTSKADVYYTYKAYLTFLSQAK